MIFFPYMYLCTNPQKPKLESISESPAPPARRGRRPVKRDPEAAEKRKKPEDLRTECSLCKQSGTNSNLVRYKSYYST